MLAVEPPRRVHLPNLFAVLEYSDAPRNHLLGAVIGGLHGVVPDGEMPHRHRFPRVKLGELIELETLPRKAEEHHDDADVHDIAAVTAP